MNTFLSSIDYFFANRVLLASNAADYSDKARILGFDQQMLISTAIHAATILLLIFILGKVLFKPVSKILVNRKENIAKEFKTIEIENETALALKKEYEIKIAEINKEADEILSNARKKALDQEGKIVQEAKQEADRIHARTSLEIEREKEKVNDDIRKEIIQVATMMASKFVAVSMTEQARNDFYEKALDEIGEDTWLN